MNPFQKKTGLAAAYAQLIDAWMAGRTFEEKARVVAAVKTGGEIEIRARFLKDGQQAFSVWLCVPGEDEAIKLVPKPEQEAAA